MKRKAEISIAIGLIISIIMSICGFGAECNKIRNDVVRLHILANSDSEEDQRVKLQVRDALLECGSEMFSGEVTVENAQELINQNKNKLISLANETLERYGFEYKADVYLTNEYFTTREYEDFTLPAGEYLALKVILGEGKGHNWWCVMFPPLCLPAATENKNLDVVFGEKGADIVSESDTYILKFKIIEIIENIRHKVKK